MKNTNLKQTETPPLKTGNVVLKLLTKNDNSYTGTTYHSDSRTSIIDAYSSVENNINKKRLLDFKNNFTSELIRLIKEQDFEYGLDSPSDSLVRKCMSKNASVTKEWLNEIFIKYYHDTTITLGILRVVSHLDYDTISPHGITMALAATPHNDQEIKEAGIRALENWGNLTCLNILETLSFEENWLADYVSQVINDLKEELV